MGSFEQQAQQWADDRLKNSELYHRNVQAKEKEFDALKRSLLEICSTGSQFPNAIFESNYILFIDRYSSLRFTDSTIISKTKYIKHRVLRMAFTDDIGDCSQADFTDPIRRECSLQR